MFDAAKLEVKLEALMAAQELIGQNASTVPCKVTF